MWIKMRSDGIKNAEQQDQNAEQRGSKCGAKGIKTRSKVDQNVEHGGAKRGARWSKGYVFLFDSKLESCLEASSFKYRITEISEKDYTKKIKSWKDRTIN